MTEFDRQRLKSLGRSARKAKQWLDNVRKDVARWNASADDELELCPNIKALSQAVDALMDLNNTCAERERLLRRKEVKS